MKLSITLCALLLAATAAGASAQQPHRRQDRREHARYTMERSGYANRAAILRAEEPRAARMRREELQERRYSGNRSYYRGGYGYPNAGHGTVYQTRPYDRDRAEARGRGNAYGRFRGSQEERREAAPARQHEHEHGDNH